MDSDPKSTTEVNMKNSSSMALDNTLDSCKCISDLKKYGHEKMQFLPVGKTVEQ